MAKMMKVLLAEREDHQWIVVRQWFVADGPSTFLNLNYQGVRLRQLDEPIETPPMRDDHER